ncbi:urease subunit gamma [Nonomuraea africana]|uniref:urease subunit gamma n=1 Tax=Nonomuraea africana TaxID=46171 RepID=UPI0033E52566
MPEATALIAHAACEAARDGARVEDAVTAARQALTATDVLPGVPHLLNEIQVEAVFDDGTKLIVITDPIPAADDPQAAPGAVLAAPATVPAHADPVTITVTNTGGVPVSVSSHYHFFEANRALAFDRASAYGTRLALQVGPDMPPTCCRWRVSRTSSAPPPTPACSSPAIPPPSTST